MVMGECSAYSSQQANSKVKCSLAYELAATWHWPTFAQRTLFYQFRAMSVQSLQSITQLKENN